MMVVSDEPKIFNDDINIIYRPKPKRVYKSNLKHSKHSHFTTTVHENKKRTQHLKKIRENWNLSLKKNAIAKSQNFDLISFEEMENDFKLLKAKSEIFEVQNELLQILENSTNDTSFNEETKSKAIKRPKNIFYTNFE